MELPSTIPPKVAESLRAFLQFEKNNVRQNTGSITLVDSLHRAICVIEQSQEDFDGKYVLPVGAEIVQLFIDFCRNNGFTITTKVMNMIDIFESRSQDTFNAIETKFFDEKNIGNVSIYDANGIYYLKNGEHNWELIRSFDYTPNEYQTAYYRSFIIIPKDDLSFFTTMFKEMMNDYFSTNILNETLDIIDVKSANFSLENYIVTPEFDQLYSDIELFLNNRKFYTDNKIPYKRGALLIGPPGNGKTYSFQYIINKFKMPVVVAEELGSINYYIRESFSSAKKITEITGKPCLIFMEELNVVLSSPSGRELLLTHLDGIDNSGMYYFIGTTNKPEEIDSAILNRPSRIDLVLQIKGPNEEVRAKFFSTSFTDWNEEQVMQAVLLTKNLSFAYLKNTYVEYVLTKGDKVYDDEHLKKICKKQKQHIKLDSRAIKTENMNKKTIGFGEEYDD